MPTPSSILRIGNAQGFWGDSTAPARLVAQAPDLDYLTLDYLAEVSMSILARQRQRDPLAGYARDFIDVIRSLAPFWKQGRKLRLVTNAGGLNPGACAAACIAALQEAGCRGLKVGIVSGDDVLSILTATAPAKAHASDHVSDQSRDHGPNHDQTQGRTSFPHLETGASLDTVIESLVTANAYLGASAIVEALNGGADIVITGRVADPSLTVAPCIAHFGWADSDFARIAGATVAGHLIECGTQVTGGISTDWMEMTMTKAIDLGYPVVEVSADGSCIVTKPAGTGGRVTERTVKEQLLYEIGDPAAYLSPDATVSFLPLRVADRGGDRVAVSGAGGHAPPPQYKVSATYRAGYRAAGMLTIVGRDAAAKAQRCGQIVLQRLQNAGYAPQRSCVECLGAGAALPGVIPQARPASDAMEIVLRIAVADARKEVVERFTRELVPLVTSGPQGTTGYFEGRPAVREVFGYWPTLIDRALVKPLAEIRTV